MILSSRVATKDDPIYKSGVTITMMKRIKGSQPNESDQITKVEEPLHCLLHGESFLVVGYNGNSVYVKRSLGDEATRKFSLASLVSTELTALSELGNESQEYEELEGITAIYSL